MEVRVAATKPAQPAVRTVRRMISNRRERNRRLQALRSAVPLVAGCTHQQLCRIDCLGAPVSVRPGERLTTEGAIGRELFLVLHGSATAHRGETWVGDIGAGSVVGEMALLDTAARAATVVASTAMQLLVLDDREFEQLLAVDPSIEEQLRTIAADRQVALDAAACG